MNIWRRYKQSFPSRYHAPGHFDKVIERTIKRHRPTSALDVGGGQDGTLALKKSGVPTWLLDPFVVKPSWVVSKVAWDDDTYAGMFDLIVARGSINYLRPTQLLRLRKKLRRGGVLIANTFKQPPPTYWVERPYEKGVERARMRSYPIVEHELISGGDVLAHTFIYYSPAHWDAFFPGVKQTSYGRNSLLLTYTRRI